MNNMHTTKEGWSLVETLMYCALFVVVMTIVSLILLSTTNVFKLAAARRTVGVTGQTALMRVVTETRQSVAVDTINSVFGATSSVVALTTYDDGVLTTMRFSVIGDVLYMRSGTGPYQPLTGSSTRVTNFTAERFTTSQNEAITFDLELASRVSASTTAHFTNTAIPRGGY